MTDLVNAQRRVLNATRAEADLLRAMDAADRLLGFRDTAP